MKITIQLFLFSLLFLSINACNTDELLEENMESKILITEERLGIVQQNNEKEESLENKMQWIAYITAQALLESGEARRVFRDELNATGTPTTVSLRDLIGHTVTDASFLSEFKNQFLYYYHIDSGTSDAGCDGSGRPNGRPKPPGTIGGIPPGTDFNSYIFDLYVASILNDDCLEFYLPNGFMYIESIGNSNPMNTPIKSTAHPLRNETSNEGFYHTSTCFVTPITINDSIPGFVLVNRPFREDIVCPYDEYAIDFEDFLN